MSNANFSSAAQHRTMLTVQEDVFAAERALQKAEDQRRVAGRLCLSGDLDIIEVDTASILVAQKLSDLRVAVGLLHAARRQWREALKAEIAEAAEYRSTLANSAQAEVLPFTVNAWDA